MNYPFDTTGLTETEITRYYETYAALKQKFNVERTGYIDFQLNTFEAFRHYPAINVRDSFLIKNAADNCYILFVETILKTMDHHRAVDHTEYHVWGLAYLKCDMGRLMIRRETLADKIKELVFPVEIDFKEDMPFSDTFYVVANDHNKAVNGIGRNFRNAVMDIRADDVVIEISGHTLIAGNNRPIAPESAVHLAEFVARLVAIC